ncbi:MAG: hypothetical protein Q9182_007180 [Xanthomendoza sp. 2 TL-2023]
MEPSAAIPPDATTRQRVSAALSRTWTTTHTKLPPSVALHPQLPPISDHRLHTSVQEKPLPNLQPPDLETLIHTSKDQTYLYLAYGSNLSASTFRGVRGIRPLAALNVLVPELVMTFDLPGLPYTEPCFANTAYRTTPPTTPAQPATSDDEKTPLVPTYSNPHWNKGMVGVVYEVTPADYAHIIATEGGGAAYQDVLVSCHPLDRDSSSVPLHPHTPAFKAHTLYCPISPPGSNPPKTGGRYSRPDPEYAQPSQRYLNLITTGAAEHALPLEYRDYLAKLQPYTITMPEQRVGRWVFSMTWLPVIRAVFWLNRVFGDEKGRSPAWLVRVQGAVFAGVWITYDGWMKGVFGDGERTVEEGKRAARKLVKRRRGMDGREKDGWVDGV